MAGTRERCGKALAERIATAESLLPKDNPQAAPPTLREPHANNFHLSGQTAQ